MAWLTACIPAVQHMIMEIKLGYFYQSGSIAEQIPELLAHYLPLRQESPKLNAALLDYDLAAGNLNIAKATLDTLVATLMF